MAASIPPSAACIARATRPNAPPLMNARDVQIIEKDGRPEYAVVPIDEYRRMVASLEESADLAATDRALRENEAGDTVPGEVVHAILDGVPPLRAWRRHRGLTLDDLAARVGVSKGYLSQIENGRKSGTLDLVRRLAAALDVTLDDLAGWPDADDEGA